MADQPHALGSTPNQPAPTQEMPRAHGTAKATRAAAQTPSAGGSVAATQTMPPGTARAAQNSAAGQKTVAAQNTAATQNGAAPRAAAAPTQPAAGRAPIDRVGLRGELAEMQEQGLFLLALRGFLRASPAWLTSMIVHLLGLLILAMLIVETEAPQILNELLANNLAEKSEQIEELPSDMLDEVDLSDTPTEMFQQVATGPLVETLEVDNNLDISASPIEVELSDLSDVRALKSDLLKTVGALGGSDLAGRGNPAARKQALVAGGGNAQSEEAVALALAWLARQQFADGGWDFTSPGSGGDLQGARNGATGMAILPFLGAGQTHKEGKYKETVRGGLYFLGSHMKQNGSLMDKGNLYSHGIASIALAEAFAMTQDRQLHAPAQGAINFIMFAQDKVGGGWRYSAGQPGDTSVVGWQLMALKSGAMGYLAINSNTIRGAEHFLNSVQTNGGANYGYMNPGARPATTAVGLLCRMYMGWKKDHPGLQKGVEYLSKAGPSKGDMYFNYYATQVLHHWEGEEWKEWNEEMRDYLIRTQVKEGPHKGSWFFAPGDHGAERGGRIYCTSMACMTLEVYYRHLPIYRKQASETEFEGP